MPTAAPRSRSPPQAVTSPNPCANWWWSLAGVPRRRFSAAVSGMRAERAARADETRARAARWSQRIASRRAVLSAKRSAGSRPRDGYLRATTWGRFLL